MSEQFADVSGMLGIRPRAEQDSAEVSGDEQNQGEIPLESEDVVPDQDGMYASDDDLTADDDYETDDDGADDGEGEDAAAAAPDPDPDAKDWKADYEKAEAQRREWQSKAMQSDSDLGKALELLRNGNGNSPQQAQQQAPRESSALARLESMDGEDLVDASTVKSLFKDFMAEQQQSRQVDEQMKQMDDFNARMRQELQSKPDRNEVIAFFQQNLKDSPETAYMTELGLYHFAKAKMLEAKEQEAFEKGKAEGAKSASGRQKRLGRMPPPSGTKGARAVATNDPSGLVNLMEQRRKDRGIGRGGSIR